MFAQEKAGDILSCWDDLAVSLAERFPKAAELMHEAREEVLAQSCGEDFVYCYLLQQHCPNDAAITRLVGAVLLEQDEHRHLESRRMFSSESMAAIAELEVLPIMLSAPA